MADLTNNYWATCPICLEDYSEINRPTTFICGHSTCISHQQGANRLQNCPICRFSLRDQTEFHISYSLEEAARYFRTLNGITSSSATVQIEHDNATVDLMAVDEEFARRLQAQFDLEERMQSFLRISQPPSLQIRPSPVPPTLQTGPSQVPPTLQTGPSHVPPRSQTEPSGNRKSCGHSCDLTTTVECCACSG